MHIAGRFRYLSKLELPPYLAKPSAYASAALSITAPARANPNFKYIPSRFMSVSSRYSFLELFAGTASSAGPASVTYEPEGSCLDLYSRAMAMSTSPSVPEGRRIARAQLPQFPRASSFGPGFPGPIVHTLRRSAPGAHVA